MDHFKNRRPWTTPTRLGIKLAWPGHREVAIGYCLYSLATTLEENEIPTSDPIGSAILEYKRMVAMHGPAGEVDLYLYRNEKHFKGSRAHKEGMTFREHCKFVQAGAERMREAGIPVRIRKAR